MNFVDLCTYTKYRYIQQSVRAINDYESAYRVIVVMIPSFEMKLVRKKKRIDTCIAASTNFFQYRSKTSKNFMFICRIRE